MIFQKYIYYGNLENLMIPIFVISLKNSIKRREYVTSQLKALNLKYELFDAYLGKDFYDNPNYYNEKKALKYEHRKLKVGEVGCSLSHNAIYKTIVTKKIPYALILEDDVIIKQELFEFLEDIEKYLYGNMIINIGRCEVYKKKKIKINDKFSMVKPRYIKQGGIAGAFGYIITLEAAKNIVNMNLPVYFPADAWGYFMKKTHMYGIIPRMSLVIPNLEHFNSTIQSDGKGLTVELNDSSKNIISNHSLPRFTEFQLLRYGFLRQTFFGRFLVFILRPFYRFLKKLLKK